MARGHHAKSAKRKSVRCQVDEKASRQDDKSTKKQVDETMSHRFFNKKRNPSKSEFVKGEIVTRQCC